MISSGLFVFVLSVVWVKPVSVRLLSLLPPFISLLKHDRWEGNVFGDMYISWTFRTNLD